MQIAARHTWSRADVTEVCLFKANPPVTVSCIPQSPLNACARFRRKIKPVLLLGMNLQRRRYSGSRCVLMRSCGMKGMAMGENRVFLGCWRQRPHLCCQQVQAEAREETQVTYSRRGKDPLRISCTDMHVHKIFRVIPANAERSAPGEN